MHESTSTIQLNNRRTKQPWRSVEEEDEQLDNIFDIAEVSRHQFPIEDIDPYSRWLSPFRAYASRAQDNANERTLGRFTLDGAQAVYTDYFRNRARISSPHTRHGNYEFTKDLDIIPLRHLSASILDLQFSDNITTMLVGASLANTSILEETDSQLSAEPSIFNNAVASLGRGFLDALLRAMGALLTRELRAVTQPANKEHFATALQASFETNPVEDGITHHAEELISKVLESSQDGVALDWLHAFCTETAHPAFAAAVLRCLGRCKEPGHRAWRVELIRTCLSIDDVEIRDAAVQAVESWHEPGLLSVLRAHIEPEEWLQRYISDILDG